VSDKRLTKPGGAGAQISALNAIDLALASQQMEAETRDFVVALLPVFDGIDRVRRGVALRADAGDTSAEAIVLVADIAEVTMARIDLERIGQVGEPVDRLRHEVVATEAVPDRAKGTVLEVVESGWVFRGVIIRPAKVVVTTDSRSTE
jgi:molecular chaperone GrpE